MTAILWGIVRWFVGLFFGWIATAATFAVLTFGLGIGISSVFFQVTAPCLFIGYGFLAARSLDFYSTVTWRTDSMIAAVVFVCAAIGLYVNAF